MVFLWLSSTSLYTETRILYPFGDVHLGCFSVLSVINSAAMNIGVHVPYSVMVSKGFMPSSGMVGSCGSFSPNF